MTDNASATMYDVADQQFSQLLANNGGLGLSRMIASGLNKESTNENRQHSPDSTQAIAQSQSTAERVRAHSGHRHGGGGDHVQISDMAALLSTDPQKLAQLQAAVQTAPTTSRPARSPTA